MVAASCGVDNGGKLVTGVNILAAGAVANVGSIKLLAGVTGVNVGVLKIELASVLFCVAAGALVDGASAFAATGARDAKAVSNALPVLVPAGNKLVTGATWVTPGATVLGINSRYKANPMPPYNNRSSVFMILYLCVHQHGYQRLEIRRVVLGYGC